jgi:hypothetical protein
MNPLYQVLLTALLVFLLAGSLLGVAVGAGLLARSARAGAFMSAANHWVSTRRVLKPVEIPRDTGHGGHGLGVVLVAVGGYSLFVLAPLSIARVAAALRIDASSTLALIGIEFAKWLLVAGCAGSVASGLMLLFFPQLWRALEDRANRWYSSRQLTTGGDDMHMPLDSLAGRHPRTAGAIVLALSLASAAATTLLLSRL